MERGLELPIQVLGQPGHGVGMAWKGRLRKLFLRFQQIRNLRFHPKANLLRVGGGQALQRTVQPQQGGHVFCGIIVSAVHKILIYGLNRAHLLQPVIQLRPPLLHPAFPGGTAPRVTGPELPGKGLQNRLVPKVFIPVGRRRPLESGIPEIAVLDGKVPDLLRRCGPILTGGISQWEFHHLQAAGAVGLEKVPVPGAGLCLLPVRGVQRQGGCSRQQPQLKSVKPNHNAQPHRIVQMYKGAVREKMRQANKMAGAVKSNCPCFR